MKKEILKKAFAWVLTLVLIVSGIGTGQITDIQAATKKPNKIDIGRFSTIPVYTKRW